LLGVRVTVTAGPPFVAEVRDVGTGAVIGVGDDYSEPAAVGLAILAARRAYEICNGCGARFYRADLVQDAAGHAWYCGDCSWDRTIPEKGG